MTRPHPQGLISKEDSRPLDLGSSKSSTAGDADRLGCEQHR
jgi:hypothetical protein